MNKWQGITWTSKVENLTYTPETYFDWSIPYRANQ